MKEVKKEDIKKAVTVICEALEAHGVEQYAGICAMKAIIETSSVKIIRKRDDGVFCIGDGE